MSRQPKFHAVPLTAAAAASLILLACGGGSDTVPTPPAPTILSGVVASGAPLAGATITVVDSDATTVDPKAVTADANGNYSVDVSGLKAPLVVKASAVVQGTPVDLVALVPSLTASSTNAANVTSLTNAVAALLAPSGDTSTLLTPATLAATATAQKVTDATSLVVNTLRTDPVIAASLGANFNPLTTTFTANGTGIDAVLDRLDINVSAAGVAITNLAAALPDSGTPVAVTLTAAQTSTPTITPMLPVSAAAADTPTAADVAALGTKIETCLAQPLATRVTMDSGGTVTALSPTCTFGAANFRSSGRNWVQVAGQFVFAKGYLTGAKVGKGVTVLTLAPFGLTDAKTFKHPYCNTATCVVVRFPFTTPSGKTSQSDWLMAKTAGGWDSVGNQNPYNVYVDPRLIRMDQQNKSTTSTTPPYYLTSRFESQMRLGVDLSFGDTNNLRAARFTGPGLPTAGVVLVRSQGCYSADRMGITSQNGSTRRNTDGVLNPWTGSTQAYFTLDAAKLDGTALTMPTPVLTTTALFSQNFSPAPVADQSTLIPAWTKYKIELFHYDVLSDTPDEVIWVRVGTAAENAATGASKQWPTLDATQVTDYVAPSGAKAAAVTSLAQTLNWTAPASLYVGSAYIYGNNTATATNSDGETGRYFLANVLSLDPAALGDLKANGYQFNDVRAGTSLSTYTQTLGSNPNPRCTPNTVPALATVDSYREIGLSFRDASRKLYQAAWIWNN